MRRALLLLFGLPLVWFTGRALVYALASDETLIRWQVESMQEGYNRGNVGDAIGPLHDHWRHEGYEFDRELVRAGLVREFFQDRDPETKKLVRRVDLEPDSLLIEVTGESARLTVDARFSRQRNDAWEEAWAARVEADLVHTDDGWRIERSRHADLRGTQLSR